jgi:hypothetical protein
MQPRGLDISFPHSPATAEITLTSAKLYVLPQEVDFFHVLKNEIFLEQFNVFCASRKCLYFIKNKLSSLLCNQKLFYISITGIS